MRENVRWILIVVLVARLLFPVVPEPGPGPNPPPPPPIVEGQRTVVIIRETEAETASFARTVVALRNGDNAEYLESKGHSLQVYDQHQLDANGQPLEIVANLLPLNSNLPAVFILDSSDGRPLHHETLPATATADDVMRILKANGG